MNHKRVVIPVSVLLAIICLGIVVKNNNQASMPIPRELTFEGEYTYDGEIWHPMKDDSDISARMGDVTVKGHFDADIEEGEMLNFFCNHIGISVYLNGERLFIDAPAEIKDYGIDLMPSMCGKRWEKVLCPAITAEDEVEFRFVNHHKYGNAKAYKEVLASLFLTPADNAVMEAYLKPYTNLFEKTGYGLLVIAVMLLGSSITAATLKSGMGNHFFKIGMATLFTGGYMVLDVMMIYLTDELLVLKTYGRQLCLMLAVYFFGIIMNDDLSGKRKKAAETVLGISAAVNILIMLFAISGKVLLYDTRIIWEPVQCVTSLSLSVLCILEMKRNKSNQTELMIYLPVNIAILFDLAGVGYHRYYSGICFKILFSVMLVVFLFKGAKQAIINYQTAVNHKKIKEELDNSRITVMLSQIQPHFLYNSLTGVMDLCDSDPKQAKAAIADFADYLRGNLSALKTENLISFRTELEHIEKYLRLEAMRFKEELEIVYDIQSKDFMIPVLSVQPLVENAVKHGVGRKIGGGTVTIHTSETEKEYLIRITDDGVGFSEGEYADENGMHVGIENVKKRLAMRINAKVEINSSKGKGTTVCIRIPKESG